MIIDYQRKEIIMPISQNLARVLRQHKDNVSMNGNKDFAANVLLPLERAGWGAAEPLTFRGEPIAWLTVPTTKTVVTANAFGDSEASERPERTA